MRNFATLASLPRNETCFKGKSTRFNRSAPESLVYVLLTAEHKGHPRIWIEKHEDTND